MAEPKNQNAASKLSGIIPILLTALFTGLIALVLYLYFVERESPYVVELNSFSDLETLTVDASKRTIYSKKSNGVVCAEPAPDAVATLAAEFASELTAGTGKVDMDLALKGLSETDVVRLFERSQGIQALRDGMYRLCEAHANDAIDQDIYEAQMFTLTATLNFIVPIELCAKLIRESQFQSTRTGRSEKPAADNGSSREDRDDPLGAVEGLYRSALTEVALSQPDSARRSAQNEYKAPSRTVPERTRDPANPLSNITDFDTPESKLMFGCVALAHNFGLHVSRDAALRYKLRKETEQQKRLLEKFERSRRAAQQPETPRDSSAAEGEISDAHGEGVQAEPAALSDDDGSS